MVRHVGMHRANDRDVVDRLRRAPKNFADFNSALAIFVELKWRCECGAGLPFRRQHAAGQGLAGIFGERWLGVERIDVRRAAVHEQMDDVFGTRGEMRRSRQQRVGCRRGSALRLHHQVAQRECAEPHSAAMKHFAARECQMF